MENPEKYAIIIALRKLIDTAARSYFAGKPILSAGEYDTVCNMLLRIDPEARDYIYAAHFS